MAKHNKRKKKAKSLRVSRKIHRTLGAVLFIFFIFISVTGALLGWKKIRAVSFSQNPIVAYLQI